MNLQNRNAVFNILGPIILNGIAFFTIPVFTRLLGPEQYGIVSVYATWVSILSTIMGLQVQGSIGPANVTYTQEEMPKYVSSILSLGCINSLLFFLLGYLLLESLSKLLLMRPDVLFFMGIQSFGVYIAGFASMVFIFRKEAIKSFSVNVSIASSSAILGILLILYVVPSEISYIGKIVGSVIPYLFISIFLILYFEIKGKWSFKVDYIKFCLPLCIPLIFHALSHTVLGQSDRIMLQHMVGNLDTGIYSFTIVFAGVLTAIWSALNNTWVPFYYDDVKAERYNEIVHKTKNYLFIFTVICAVFLFWSPEVIKIFVPDKFWGSIYLLPYFVLSNYFIFLYSFPVNFEFYNKKTYLIAISTVLSAGINILLNFLLIRPMGIAGAALATLISHILLFVFHQYAAKNLMKLRYHYKILDFVPGIIAMGFAICVFLIGYERPVLRWGIGFALFIWFWLHLYREKRIF